MQRRVPFAFQGRSFDEKLLVHALGSATELDASRAQGRPPWEKKGGRRESASGSPNWEPLTDAGLLPVSHIKAPAGQPGSLCLTAAPEPDNTRSQMNADRMHADRLWWWQLSQEWALVA